MSISDTLKKVLPAIILFIYIASFNNITGVASSGEEISNIVIAPGTTEFIEFGNVTFGEWIFWNWSSDIDVDVILIQPDGIELNNVPNVCGQICFWSGIWKIAFINHNLSASANVRCIIEIVPEMYNIESPQQNDYLNSSAVEFSGTGSKLIDSVYIENVEGGRFNCTIENGLWHGIMNIPEGDNWVNVVFNIHWQNYWAKTSRSMFITVDLTPPNLSIVQPINQSIITSSSILLQWEANDTSSGIHHCEYQIDEGIWIGTGNPNHAQLSGLTDGHHVVRVKAIDKVRNSAIKQVEFTIDTNAFSINGPYKGIPSFVGITALIIIVMIVIFRQYRKKMHENKNGEKDSKTPDSLMEKYKYIQKKP